MNKAENLKRAESAKQKVLKVVRKLCRNKYVKIRDFSPSLRRKCVRYFGSVRAAKWEAGVINDKRWKYRDFLNYIHHYCNKMYCDDRSVSADLKHWARYFCGSIRGAKWEAKIILDPRTHERHLNKRALTKEDVIQWIKKHPFQKIHLWPAHIIAHSEHFFKSTRGARLAAGVLQDERKKTRTTPL